MSFGQRDKSMKVISFNEGRNCAASSVISTQQDSCIAFILGHLLEILLRVESLLKVLFEEKLRYLIPFANL